MLLGLSQDKRFVMAAELQGQPENARRFLGDLGNPFQAIGVDEAGRTAIDWGVYGVPETFVIGKDGKIAYKHVGPLTAETARELLLPQIEKALAVPVRRSRLPHPGRSNEEATAPRVVAGEKQPDDAARC